MYPNLFLYIIIIFLFKKISCADECSSNCHTCRNNKICTQCENNYILVGDHEFSPNKEIKCNPSSDSTIYFITKSLVHYPCSNTDYAYLRNDESKCYRRDDLAIDNYYTTNDKNYYPCNENNDVINGIPNCGECQLKNDRLLCTNCKYFFAFLNNDHTQCHSKDELDGDKSYYKEDDQNYYSCSIGNCSYCSSKTICTQCKNNYYLKNYDRSHCYLEEEIVPLNEYYLNDDGLIFYSCSLNGGIEHCKTCESKTECNICDRGYTILNDNKTKCEKISELKKTPNLYYTHDINELKYYSCVKYDNDNKHCLECIFPDVDNFQCLKCETGYYFLEDNSNPDECIKESDISNEYYKYDDTLYKKCSSAIDKCETCENENKCLTCSDNDYGILDLNYSLCQNIRIGLDDNLIYQDNDLYYTCEINFIGCKKCTSNNFCLKTISEEYCLLSENTIYKLNTSGDIYYYSNSDDSCINCINVFDNCKLCLSENKCIQCNEGFALIDEASCDYIAAYEINNEYFSDDNFINFYKCDNTDLSSKAINNCEKCEYNNEKKNNNCTKCINGYIILDNDEHLCIERTASIEQKITEKKLVTNDSGNKYYTCSKLMRNCDTCEDMEICSTCKDNYAFLDGDKTQCYLRDNFIHGHFFTNDSGINYYSCVDNCSKCDNSYECIKCDKDFELNDLKTKCNLILKNDEDIRQNCIYITYNMEVSEIPLNEHNIYELAKDYWNDHQKDNNYLVKYINQNIDLAILIFKNYQCSLYLYEEDNKFKIDTYNIIKEFKKYVEYKEIIQVLILYKNHTAINFFDNKNGNKLDIKEKCPSCLNKKYKLIYNYENKLKNELGLKYTELVKEYNINIFDELSEYFQDFCENLQMSGIDIPLNERQYLLYKGSFSYNLDDITKGDLFACDVNCTLINNNPNEFLSECECDIEYDIDNFRENVDNIEIINEEKMNENKKKDLSKNYNFIENSKDSFSMFTCTKGSFSANNIKNNPGFYTVTTCLIVQSIFFITLICKQTITSFAKLLILANPPKLNIKGPNKKRLTKITDNDFFLTESEEDKNKYNYVNKKTNTIVNIPKVPISTSSNNNLEIKEISNSSISEKENNDDNGEVFHQRMNIYKGNNLNLNIEEDKNSEFEYYPIMKFIEYDVNVYRDIGYTYDKKDIKELRKIYQGVKMIKYNLLFKNEKNKILPLIYKPLLKDFLPYKYASYYDKRSFVDLYLYFLKLRHPIINLCINNNNISQNFIPFSVKAIKFIFIGLLIMFFNSLLITQKYLYDKFVFFDEKYNFKNMQLNENIIYSEKIKYGLKHSFSIGFYTYLIVLIFDIIISLILSIRFRVKLLLDEFYEIDSGKNNVINKNKKEQKNFEKELLKASELKNIYLWTTFVFYIFFILFFIYIINFCYSYKGEIPELFFGSLFTFLFYCFIPFFSNLFLALLRRISLDEDCELTYNISKYIIEI